MKWLHKSLALVLLGALAGCTTMTTRQPDPGHALLDAAPEESETDRIDRFRLVSVNGRSTSGTQIMLKPGLTTVGASFEWPQGGRKKDEQLACMHRKADIRCLPGSCDYSENLDPVDVCILAARMCRYQGDSELAREAIDITLTIAPDNVEALRIKTLVLDDLELSEEAFAVPRQLLDSAGDDVSTNDLSLAGDLARRTGRSEESRIIWERVASRAADN